MINKPPQGYKALAGSEREPLAQARPVAPADPNEQIKVSVYLRTPNADKLRKIVSERRQMSKKDFIDSHSAAPDDMKKVEQFAASHHLTIVEKNPVSKKIVLAGSVIAMGQAFATQLHQYEGPGGRYRGRTGPIHIPEELDGIITGVFGLDDRPQALPRLKRYQPEVAAEATAQSYTVPQLGQIYDFPGGNGQNLDGSSQCIALLELNGGFRLKDLQTYFNRLTINPPVVTAESVDGSGNHPIGTPNSDDGEVDLDIEVAGAIAPGAHIVVYFAPNTDQGFIDAITQAIHDTQNNPSVLSISWGAPEEQWTPQAMTLMDQAFQAAAALGVTVLTAAGDAGSSDRISDGKAHVDFPSSSPYVTSCGGTRLEAANNQRTREVVWNDGPDSATGGGVSNFFPLPSWQSQAQVPPSANDEHIGRGVPDVAGNADPQTGYQIYVDGQDVVFGGTSAVAPLWAGLIALINQQRGQSIGYLNPILYQNNNQNNAFFDITQGDNGDYTAERGWDACTGLGSPDGVQVLQFLQANAQVGMPVSAD